MKRHHEPPVLLYFSGFPGWLAWFSLQMFCLNNKIHFSLANANNSASFKRKMVLNHPFCSITTTNKLVNEAPNHSARVSGQDRKKLPTLGTNQIAGFGGFSPLASLEKNNISFYRTEPPSGQDETNTPFWSATRAGKMRPSYPLGISRVGPAMNKFCF